ncbi:MAG: glucokinase [Bacteroidota bacterium]|nr:glucokinase [Bacteroidota bacterium]MDP4218016.1 glucokinase [Bacteroidota bacterium]MDP4244465.1 glucokinase [Bacteroidota bacterium]MDP4258193.1 glucokinase [Bacteroidota bacterium]
MPYAPLIPIAFARNMNASMADLRILAADVGGTKTNMALYRFAAGGLTIEKEEKYASSDYHSLKDIIDAFSGGRPADRICAAVAGPVWHGRSHLTNLSWELDSRELSGVLRVPVRFINDLEATAYGLAGLQAGELTTMAPGEPGAEGNLAIIAPGTGLGEGGLYWDGRCYHPFATEGGHSDFAPRNELDIELFRYLQKQFGHVSWERVVSGMGIRTLYRFLTEARGEPVPDWLAQRMQAEDPAAVISEAAMQREDPVCSEVMTLFGRYLATEAASLVLKLKSTGGLYIGGGIPPKILPLLQGPDWVKNFDNEGRMHDLLEKVPVHVILNDKMALMGAAYYGAFSM